MTNEDFDIAYAVLKEHFENNKTPVIDLMAIEDGDPYKILVGSILSTRTKDETTSTACKKLFEKADNLEKLATLSTEEIEKLIFPVGFYREKAKNLKQIPHIVNEKFGGVIPKTIDELLEFPGVGRKVANLVVAAAFKLPAICVDTHVHRIFNRLGYIKTKNPLETEMALRKKLPEKYWLGVNGYMVSYGQNICRPISPKCEICKISEICEFTNKETLQKYHKAISETQFAGQRAGITPEIINDVIKEYRREKRI
ncbi:MAG: endonuclease III [Chitinivibrionia bacterium]|nr:endonuclease III [Chitinivibrionia bacterium]